MGEIKKQIIVCDEDILNLRSAFDMLVKIGTPYVDLEPLTVKSIIDRWESADEVSI